VDVGLGLGLFLARLLVGPARFVDAGLGVAWRESTLERYKMRHLHYGELPARFDGTGWALFKRAWWLWLLSLPIITVPYTYPIYKGVLWRWWVSGICFGEVRFKSELRIGRVARLYWIVFGWILVLLLVDAALIKITSEAVVRFAASGSVFSSRSIGSNGLLLFSRQHPYLIFGAGIANYLIV
jgi:uncharacterized membrane protein YjgN (DUF898 family)